MSEAECELVKIAGIYENSMGQYIATYEALDVLTPDWNLNSKAFYDHIDTILHPVGDPNRDSKAEKALRRGIVEEALKVLEHRDNQ